VNDDVIRVLLVEDDEDDYILIRELLSNVRRTKYILEWVPSYERAIEKMACGLNQVYLLDYRLGARNAIDILKGMQERGCSAPMILVTGHEDYDVDFEAMRLGATDYLVKSQLNGPLLDRSIRYALERWRAQEALRKAHDELELRVQERTAELAAANQALERSTREIKFFAYTVSHDLKNPAFAIHGYVKRLSELFGDANETGREYCHRILESAEQLVELVQKINTYITAKEAPLHVERVPLGEMFELIREEFRAELKRRVVDLHIPAAAPDILADKISLLRVMRNLVENALKYGGEDLSRIEVDYKDNGGHHIISVTDNGKGLQEGDAEKIFGPFFRSKTSRGVEGAGLGLATVREIAHHHKGEVWTTSGKEKGATFSVSISKGLALSP
jgi:signal transduction histidine kinase